LKKILILISIFAVLSLAAEIPCDDVLRMADTSGVTIMPKTFDAIQDGSWVCHEEAGGYVAVSTTSHHILRIEGGVSVDAYVERLSRGEQEVAVRIDQTRRRSVSFLPFGRIGDMQQPYL